jgi:hypothetical protein
MFIRMERLQEAQGIVGTMHIVKAKPAAKAMSAVKATPTVKVAIFTVEVVMFKVDVAMSTVEAAMLTVELAMPTIAAFPTVLKVHTAPTLSFPTVSAWLAESICLCILEVY